MIKLNTFLTYNYDGDFTLPKTPDERQLFDIKRMDAGINIGFNGLKTVFPKNSLSSSLTTVKLTHELINGKLDLYDLDFVADITLMESDITNIVVCYPVNDYPVLFIQDLKNNVVATGYCSYERLSYNLPTKMVNELRKEYDTKNDDVLVYIGPYAHDNERFDYRIGIDKKIIKNLNDVGINKELICTSTYDTLTNPDLFSLHLGIETDDESKEGKFLEGCYYSSSDTKRKILK